MNRLEILKKAQEIIKRDCKYVFHGGSETAEEIHPEFMAALSEEIANLLAEQKAGDEGLREEIDLGLCVGFYSEDDKDYSFAPASGRFPLEKINGKKGRLVFIEEKS
jgi:hypothetical protein